MRAFEETQISKAIIDAYHEKISNRIINDVLIVGAGPAGLTASFYLTKQGFKVTLIERNLSPGGGIWGGGMGMNDVVFQEEALPTLKEFGLRHRQRDEGLYTVDAVELASGLCFKALQAGAEVLNLLTLEDVSVHGGRITGVVVNRTGLSGRLLVDPLTFSARAIVDATGHEAVVLDTIRRRGFFRDTPIEQALEGPMNASEGEDFVVRKAGQVYPGLWVAGMSVCATFGGPRMGPIFGGMLLSGKRVAELIAAELKTSG
ncbi:MAG: thiazole biosynthesis protein [Phycisphaerae bacterium]|nr:thiazole biosynthesis protein [Phycisphaerae bacterium]